MEQHLVPATETEQMIPLRFNGRLMAIPTYTTEQLVQPLKQYLPGVPINKFNAAGDPIYAFSDETGHKFFDICDCDYCLMSSSDEEEKPRRRKKKSSQQILKERYESGDPEVGLLGEPTGKEFEYYVLYSNGSTPPTPDNEDVRICYMFGSSSSQEPTFPTREFEEGNIRHSWKIRNPNESELRSLKAQLQSLQNQPKTQTPMPYDLFTPYHIYSPPAMTQTQPLPFSHDPSIFGSSSFLPTRIKEQRPAKKKHPTVPKETLKISAPENTKTTSPEKGEAQFMKRTTEASNSTDSHSGFSFDNVPPSKWRDKIYEMHAWLTEQLLNPGATLPTVIDKLISKFQGRLRQWWISLGDYRQLHIRQSQSVDTVIGHIHNEFLGTWDHYTIQAREEYMSMRCCSFKRKDLEKHYERMSKRFYVLNGIDDVNLKQAYLNSLPEPLGNETSQILSLKNMTLSQASLGEIYQISLAALEKLCNHQKFFKQLQEKGKLLGRACDRPELSIKCKTKRCKCSTSYKQEKKSRNKWQKRYPKLSGGKKWKFFRRKKQRGYTKSDRCYICKKKRHYAKQCPNKKKRDYLIGYLAQVEDIDDSDIESIFSLDDGPTDDTVLAMGIEHDDEFSEESETEEEEDADDQFMLFDLYTLDSCKVEESKKADLAYLSQPAPNSKIYIFPTKYDKPIPVIAFFDTGVASSIIKPDILPSTHWDRCSVAFKAANGQIFHISLISKPIHIQLFLGYMVKSKVYGSDLPGKDFILGFDILYSLKRFYPMELLNPIKEEITKTSCASSHSEFLTKCSSPLWQNSDFFISLPFKKNEDINPTKASHPGMKPDHYTLALEEVNLLQKEGLIEKTTSPWACEAFYVNQRAGQVREKLRLVINYQPLNHFLADDKFPLPKREVLFQRLPQAQVFSKFDLKAGFWQLGIKQEDIPKTGFCIADRRFQWKVTPFGLKVAPSLFQKAMTKIFEPILPNALVYIDDILLFSPEIDSHTRLLEKFHKIVQQYGIMLSEKKMAIRETEIDFLGMHISKGQYHLQPHIATQLNEFPDDKLSFKQVQQFLGVVNYMAEFIHGLAKYRSILSTQLKKDAPPWDERCTEVVKELKRISKTLPSLKIPFKGKRILQTDASDCYWDSEKHYHSTYKEILAVKRGIEKFGFHLVGQHFLIEMDMSSFPKMIQFKQKILPQAQLLRWASWFSQWKFDVKHNIGKDNFLPDFLSRTQRQISAVIPMICTLTPTEESLRDMIAKMPQGIQEKILETALVYQRCEKLHGFLKLYVYRYGLDQGPLLQLPYHPVFPFLTTIDLNPTHYGKFLQEAYFLLWYLAELYTIGVLIDKSRLLQYLAKCILTRRKEHYKLLYKWLTLFHDVTWWQENIRAQEGYKVLVTFNIITKQEQQEDGVIIQREYKAHIQTSYNDDPFDGENFHIRTRNLAAINHIEESEIDPQLFCPHTANWHNRDAYPHDFIDEIRQNLASFHDQYAWPQDDPDHPIYRVEGKKYTIKRYIPGPQNLHNEDSF
ncbi:hypothetical protein EUTSA_v10028344mg [Eutrema salsugineum]|uniref:CCHC-type domain-containing protein n=1 Tax=Eutrema salsugineum TaxID=72664 RepID=V4M518_EUTSA|nr:hypothetical protein EUTSA_v10028344mg [Eutrema salsugineum]